MSAQEVRHAGLLGFALPGLAAESLRHVFAARDPASGAGNLALSGDRDRGRALAARAAWSEHLGARPQDWVGCALEHGARVRVVGEAERGRGAERAEDVLHPADGLVTATPGLVLYLPVADCAAVLMLADGRQPRLGLFHAGWRGLAAGILRAGARRMREGGDADAPLRAWISPCARAIAYEVGPEVTELAPTAAVQRDGTRTSVDIGLWCAAELRACGLAPAAIRDCGLDTLTDPRFFSHRRQGAGAGRNALLAALSVRRP